MSMRKLIVVGFLAAAFVGSLFQTAFTFEYSHTKTVQDFNPNWNKTLYLDPECKFDPNWKEKQDAVFRRTGVKEGEIYNSSNADKIKEFLPSSVYNWIKKDEWQIKIGALKYDLGPDWGHMEKWSKNNSGKYIVGENSEIIEVATGKFPKQMDGITFPIEEIDFSNKEDAPIKLLHNKNSFLWGGGNAKAQFVMEWVGVNGYERHVKGEVTLFHFLQDHNHVPNPNNFKTVTTTVFLEPYDIKGTAQLSWKFLDGQPDRSFAYIPVIRRVKRVSAANRSDPNIGADFCLDDGFAFDGYIGSMKWKLIGEQDYLCPMMKDVTERLIYYKKFPDGSFRGVHDAEPLKAGYNDPDWKGAPWAILNAVWVPRSAWVIEFYPKDRYYNYGKQILYIDKRGRQPVFKIVYNRAGQYWKTVFVMYNCIVGRNKLIGSVSTMYMAVDDKKHHATMMISDGKYRGVNFTMMSFMNWVTPAMFTTSYMTQMSR
ncbi:MAG: DUF1329 domain-containing protein [Desulfobacteraceae bacterium]|nr:DUF1329 domain-containing protein [Desulfobacteraceae bacterium]